MTTFNAYDNQIYAYGKGQTSLTLNAPNTGITTNSTVTLTGRIVDNSPGSKQTAQAANFPNGIPVVSDESMSRFMEYVYMQQPMPTNTTGVPIQFSVVDSNGNTRTIGSTISNPEGGFTFNWTPDITGPYTVTASFPGTQSYFSTSAQTTIYAGSHSTSSASNNQGTGQTSTADTYFIPAIVGIAIILIVILVLLAVLLRRR
jgi:hypothetical protein